MRLLSTRDDRQGWIRTHPFGKRAGQAVIIGFVMSTLGIILVIVGAALMVAEAHVPTHGLLGTVQSRR